MAINLPPVLHTPLPNRWASAPSRPPPQKVAGFHWTKLTKALPPLHVPFKAKLEKDGKDRRVLATDGKTVWIDLPVKTDASKTGFRWAHQDPDRQVTHWAHLPPPPPAAG